MKLSNQYQATAANPPVSREGIVTAFNSAYRPDSANGSHWSRYQYTPTGDSLADSLNEVSEKDRKQISAMSRDYASQTTSDTVSILDFGSGDGRLRGVYEQLGNDLQASGKNLRVVALDTSREALNQFAIKLKQAGFQEQGDSSKVARDLTGNDRGYLFDEFTKGNVTIRLVHSNIDNTPNQVKELVLENNGKQNISLTLGFDSLSFIEGQDNRAEFIKMFRDITDADLLLTVPGLNVEKWQPLLHEFNQRRLTSDRGVGHATEPNSFMYNFRGNHLFYKLFKRAELAADAAKAGLNDFAVRINQLWHPQRHKEQEGLAAVDKQNTDAYNALVDQHGHTDHLDSIFDTVDGFIQLHHKPSKELSPHYSLD
jgi:SAM-dependent methyltransferase